MTIEKILSELLVALNNLTETTKELTGAYNDSLTEEVEETVEEVKPIKNDRIKIEPKISEVKTNKKEVAKKVETEESEDDLFGDDEKDATPNDVKLLSKEKMSNGVDRGTIKSIITKLGGESIADLDQKGLNSLRDQLNKL